MEVDRFDPRRKNDYIQDYQNLFLATRHCNGAKRDNWPTAKEDAEGYRFLNCCEERDYGVHLFEDPHTHKIKWTTRAGGYHAIHCDLDAPHLVEERRQRAELLHLLHETPVLAKQSPPELLACLEKIREQLKLMIPEIPAPPKQATGLPD